MNTNIHGFGVYEAKTKRPVELAMQELWLAGTLLPIGGRLVVRHTFQSKARKPVEVIYAFMLPRDAAMRRFRIEGKDFSIESELLPVPQARETYEDAVEKGHLASVAQQYEDGIVNLSVGNIRPGETVTVHLELAAGVTLTDDGFRFRFPFTLAPSYHAQATASVISAGEGEMQLPEEIFGDVLLPSWRFDPSGLHRVGFSLDVQIAGVESEVSSPSHPISCGFGKDGRVKVALATSSDVPDRDLVLDVRHSSKEPLVFTGLDADGFGRFAALFSSTLFGAGKEKVARQLVFLIDHSDSMDGRPFQQAQQAVLACIGALNPEDRFGIVFFETSTTTFGGGCEKADQKRREAAQAFVRGMEVAGGTELDAGLEAAAELLPKGGDILLLTDGQVFETGAIIQKAIRRGLRVHCLGIGSASSDRFLAQLSDSTGGVSHFATARERVDVAALKLFNSIGRQVAKELECSLSGADEQGVIAPQPASGVVEGHPLLVFGRARAGNDMALELRWEGGKLRLALPWGRAGDNPEKSGDVAMSMGETLKLIQGARITTTLELAPDFGELPETRKKSRYERHLKRLESIGREYGLANPAMALVAVVKRADDKSDGTMLTQIVPVGMPEDTAFDSVFQPSPALCNALVSANGFGFAVGGAGSVAGGRRTKRCLIDRPEASPVQRESQLPAEPLPAPPAQYFRSAPSAPPAPACMAYDGGDRVDEEATDPWLGRLVELTGMLEADGGLAGSDLDFRVAWTLVVMVALSAHESGQELFAGHAERMRAFLIKVIEKPEVAAQKENVERVLGVMDGGLRLTEESWKAFDRLGGSCSVDECWAWIELVCGV